MTAVSAFLGREAAFLITDAASCGYDGTIVRISSKAITSDHLRIAAAMSGRACDIITESDRLYSPSNDARAALEASANQQEFMAQLQQLTSELGQKVLADTG